MNRNTTINHRISVIIPVYNEAAIINQTISHVREVSGGTDVEIVVADGGPGHETLAVIQDTEVVCVQSPAGRGVQMNSGAAQAQGDVFLFLHADTRLPKNGFQAVERAIRDGAAAGAFSLSIDSPKRSLSMVAWFANLRSKLERVPYGDQAHFIRAETFQALGGYPPIPLMEDVELFRRIRAQRLPMTIVPEKVATSSRRWDNEGVLFRTINNWRLRLMFFLGVSPEKLTASYRPPNTKAETE